MDAIAFTRNTDRSPANVTVATWLSWAADEQTSAFKHLKCSAQPNLTKRQRKAQRLDALGRMTGCMTFVGAALAELPGLSVEVR